MRTSPAPKFELGDRVTLHHEPGEHCPDPHPEVGPQFAFRVSGRAWWETNEIGQPSGTMGWMYKLLYEKTKKEMTCWGGGWVNENRMRRAPEGNWSQEAI
jgi:hypothetical protein